MVVQALKVDTLIGFEQLLPAPSLEMHASGSFMVSIEKTAGLLARCWRTGMTTVDSNACPPEPVLMSPAWPPPTTPLPRLVAFSMNEESNRTRFR